MAWIREEPDGAYVVATACTICDRPIPPDADYPLCRRCIDTAEAAARASANVRRNPLDHHDRRFA